MGQRSRPILCPKSLAATTPRSRRRSSRRFPDEQGDDDVPFYDLAPDWVCEVLSPSTAGKDRMKKVAIYRREGVRHVWLVDPQQRTVDVYRLDGEHYVLVGTFGEAEVVRVEPFDAIELPLGMLWPGGAPGGTAGR